MRDGSRASRRGGPAPNAPKWIPNPSRAARTCIAGGCPPFKRPWTSLTTYTMVETRGRPCPPSSIQAIIPPVFPLQHSPRLTPVSEEVDDDHLAGGCIVDGGPKCVLRKRKSTGQYSARGRHRAGQVQRREGKALWGRKAYLYMVAQPWDRSLNATCEQSHSDSRDRARSTKVARKKTCQCKRYSR